MFTGIITQTTPVKSSQKRKKGMTVTFQRPAAWTDLSLGESVATNGVCLTLTAIRTDEYDCDLMQETLAKTAFGTQLPKVVNLERALAASDRFGGHFVQGHVDGVGKVSQIDASNGFRLSVTFDSKDRELVIYKGSITINGVSLTVAEVKGNTLSVGLVPYTLEHTTMDTLKVGELVNLEFDMMGKYIVNAMEIREYNAAR